MRLHRATVLPGGQIQDEIRLAAQPPGQPVPPKAVEIPAAVHRQLRLHLQPVRRHAVKGTQQSVKAGENPQTFPEVVQRPRLHHSRRHVAVLNTLVGQKGGGEAAAQVHPLQPFYILTGDGVAAFPQGLQGLG